jgi:hypothetical protein
MFRIIVASAALAAATGFAQAQSDSNLINRGDYLVNGILTCGK